MRLGLRLTFHVLKSVRIPSFSGPHFPTFGLNTEIYFVNLRIQTECGKIRTRKTPNTDTFYGGFEFIFLFFIFFNCLISEK